MTRYAYANKHQMKVWNSASKPDKDYGIRPTDSVMFEIKKQDKGYVATITGTDGYQLMRRNIQTDQDATDAIKVAIPRDAVEQAEKAMKLGDRCFFGDNRLEVVEITRDPDTQEEIERTKAWVPFIEQLDLFRDFDSAIEKEANKEYPEKVVTLDARVLKKLVEQMRSGDAVPYVTIRMRGELDGVIMSIWDGIEDEQLTAVGMPIKS